MSTPEVTLTNTKIALVEGINRTAECAHTMGPLLSKYVLPKVPPRAVLTAAETVNIVYSSDIEDFRSVGKQGHKNFNWRRPRFVAEYDNQLTCILPPGQDYTHHYVELLKTAAQFYESELDFARPLLTTQEGLDFMRSLVREDLGSFDAVVLGYVEHLFVEGEVSWDVRRGVGYRTFDLNGFRILLIGFELSYWGDIGGQLVQVLAERGITDWVIYVGKLGALHADVVPNRTIATGSVSIVEGSEVSWVSRLIPEVASDDAGITVLTGQVHATEPSTLDETVEWLRRNSARASLVDPEIGRMAAAARDAGITFDYLHVVSDNLSGGYEHGLFDEHFGEIKASRGRCLQLIERILVRSFQG